MISLGQASNYSFGRILRHLFAWGTKRDSEKLRKALAKKYQVKLHQVALYHTGRSALAVAIRAAAQGQRYYVVLPGLTCIAVIRAIKAAGCEPVFVDIESQTLQYNYQKLDQKLAELSQNLPKSPKPIDKKDSVCYNGIIVLVQNTLGISWNVSQIEKITQKYHAKIVEDLAHSAGRFYADGREVGTVGVSAALSFGKGKAIDTISGGVAILRNSKDISQPQRRPKLSDSLRDRWYPVFGGISRIFGKIGCVLMGCLVKIHFVQRSADAELDTNRRLTHWQAKLALRQLGSLPTNKLRDYRLVVHRDRALEKLRQNGYNFSEIWYDTPVSPQRYEREANFPTQECPDTVSIAQQIVNFPTWYGEDKLRKAYDIVSKSEVK